MNLTCFKFLSEVCSKAMRRYWYWRCSWIGKYSELPTLQYFFDGKCNIYDWKISLALTLSHTHHRCFFMLPQYVCIINIHSHSLFIFISSQRKFAWFYLACVHQSTFLTNIHPSIHTVIFIGYRYRRSDIKFYFRKERRKKSFIS